MTNIAKIKKLSKNIHLLLSSLIVVIPIYYIGYWLFINDLPKTLITVNTLPTPLVPNKLSVTLQLLGFVACLFPLSALTYGLINVRKLFSYYKDGVIFSLEHVNIFKHIAKALILWVVLSILYNSAKSVLFSIGNPSGHLLLTVGVTSAELTTLIVGMVMFVIAWVMDEGRALAEEQQLTI